MPDKAVSYCVLVLYRRACRCCAGRWRLASPPWGQIPRGLCASLSIRQHVTASRDAIVVHLACVDDTSEAITVTVKPSRLYVQTPHGQHRLIASLLVLTLKN